MTTVRGYDSPLRAEQQERTRIRILEAVGDLLSDESVEELTVPLVAKRARVSVRTVYRHFATRDELFDAWGEWAQDNLRILMHSYPETLEGLRAMAPSLYRSYDENETMIRALLNSKGARAMRLRTRRRRLQATEDALREITRELDPESRRRAIAVVYLLISAPAWQAMRDQWGLDGAEAGKAAAWAVRVLTDELQRNPESIKEE
jgi:AcrR family transcriptional regulator